MLLRHQGLNEEQQEAVETIDGPLLVLAGAGSGKTRVVTYRIAHMIEKGVPPTSILGLTFTNKAAREMKERVIKLTNQSVWISTFHSLGAKILRESIHLIGFPSNFAIYDSQDTDKLVKACLLELYPNEKKLDYKTFKSMISKAKNAIQLPDQIERGLNCSQTETLFPDVYMLYQKKLQSYGALDFDDLLFLTVRLFQECEEVLQMYQKRWSHLLIDEYQDTNQAQYMMISHLVEKSENLCVVGDPDQSIYSWRGANIRNILDFERDYSGTKVIRLEKNYRSCSTILEAANALIAFNKDRLEKNLYSALGPGEKIKSYTSYNERGEAEYIAERIRYHHDFNGIALNDMVIFYRTNAQSRVFEDEFLFQKIPYTIVGGVSFYQRKEIKDILALLRMAQSERDFVSFERTINIPKRGIGAATIEKIRMGAESEGVSILVFCLSLLSENVPFKITARHKKGLREYLDVILHLRELVEKGESIGELVRQAIERSGYLAHLSSQDLDTFDDRKENLDALVAKALEWEESAENRNLDAFLEELTLKSSLDNVTEDQESVSLMTIHNGKGLEYTVTFLAGLEEDLFPHVNARKSEEALEEERRLCYVGMTRAKEFLYLVNCENRFMWGMQRRQRPSRFLKEVPYHLKEIVY